MSNIHSYTTAASFDPLFVILLVAVVFGGLLVFELVTKFIARARRRQLRSDGPGRAEVSEEDRANAVAGGNLITLEEDLAAAAKWWDLQSKVQQIVVTGQATFEVDGKGTAAIDGLDRLLSGKEKFDSAGEVKLSFEGKAQVSFPSVGAIRLGSEGEVRVEGSGEVIIDAVGTVRLSGEGKMTAVNCREVSTGLNAENLTFEARNCKTVHSGEAKVFHGYDCAMVYCRGRAFVYRCKQVSAQGNAQVYAAECETVRALDRSKVLYRQCADIGKSDEGTIEPVQPQVETDN